MKRQYPTTAQANGLFFITVVLTYVGSSLLILRLGIGTNLWINEYVYILLPALLFVKQSKWPVDDIFSFKKTTARNKITSILSGISMWLFAFYISVIIRFILDNKLGELDIPLQEQSVYQNILLLIGMIVLAPICEEILFRGFIQKAYEGHSKKYGFIITGVIFGYYHILNGVSEVIPATILGITMGYLVYKTGSILNSILFHAMANTSSVCLSGVLGARITTRIPVWLHVLGFLGLFISIILLRNIKSDSISLENEEEEKEEQDDIKTLSAIGIVLLLLSAIFLTGIGIYEIWFRLQ